MKSNFWHRTPDPALVELDAATSHAARLLHDLGGRLRERFIAVGLFDDAVARDLEDLGRIAAALDAMARMDGAVPVPLPERRRTP